mgnify:CR=1 FL=1
MSRGARIVALVVALPFPYVLATSERRAEGLACAALFSGLVLGLAAILYAFRVARRRMGFMLTLLAVHEHGLLLRTEGRTVFAPWANVARSYRSVARFGSARFDVFHVELRNGVTMTYGDDLWSVRDAARIAAFIAGKLQATAQR